MKHEAEGVDANEEETEETEDSKELTLVVHNVRSLDTHNVALIHKDADVHIWTEASVPARARHILRETFWEENQRLIFARLSDRGKNNAEDQEEDDGPNSTRIAKVVMACRRNLSPVALQAEDHQDAILLESGRWVERLVPIGDGQRGIIIAGIYGISGAAGNAGKRVANERLLSQALVRATSFLDTPYILAGDFNINPGASEAIKAATQEGSMVDAFDEWEAGNPSPTFCHEGVFEGMDGPQKTRIDGILANRAAKVLIQKPEIRWTRSLGFDHACLALKFNIEACCQKVWRLRQPVPIDLASSVFEAPQ